MNVLPGRKCRIGMYVATSTDEKMLDELKGWQQGETGTAVKYKVNLRVLSQPSHGADSSVRQWVFTIPKGCRQATMISQVSHYAKEKEVLIVPYR